MLARRVGEALDQLNAQHAGGMSGRRGDRGLRGADACACRIGAVGKPFRHLREVQKNSARARRFGGHATGRERSRAAWRTRFGRSCPGWNNHGIRGARPSETRGLAPALARASAGCGRRAGCLVRDEAALARCGSGRFGNSVAQAPKEEMPPSPAPAQVDLLSKVAPQKGPKTVAAPSDRLSTNTPSRNSPEEAPAKRSADAVNAVGGLASSAPDSRNRPQNEKKESARMDAEVKGESPSAPPPPPAAVPPPSVLGQTARSAIASPKSPESASQSVTVTEAAPQFEANSSAKTLAREKQVAPPQQAAGAPAAPAPPPQAIVRSRDLQGFAALKADQPAFIQATAPFGSTVWRLGKGGKIERSADGGETWNSQMSPILEDWLAGVAVSDMVCWAAGRNGSIARTTDGDRWERIAPPAVSAAANAKLPDWTGITARDAQSATITASDGRKFATADGGKTWQAQ